MTEPEAVTQIRTMLLACASVSGAGITSDRLYYPKAAVTADDSTTPATKPYGVLDEVFSSRKRFLEPGVLGLPSGTIQVVWHFDPDIGTIEDFARDVAAELYSQASGLPIRDVSTDLSTEPTPGELAADLTTSTAAEVTATTTIEWGLSG